MADSRKQRKTLFHQGDTLLEFTAIRGRPAREEHSGAAHPWKLVSLR